VISVWKKVAVDDGSSELLCILLLFCIRKAWSYCCIRITIPSDANKLLWLINIINIVQMLHVPKLVFRLYILKNTKKLSVSKTRKLLVKSKNVSQNTNIMISWNVKKSYLKNVSIVHNSVYRIELLFESWYPSLPVMPRPEQL